MSLSRKRRKELNRLRASAEELWSHQQDVLDHANSIAKEAGRQVGHLTREEVAPRVRDGYSQYLQPRVDGARQFASDTGQTIEKIQKDTDRDNFMSGETAVAYGMLDKVLEHRATAVPPPAK